jgi:hypothetical protein
MFNSNNYEKWGEGSLVWEWKIFAYAGNSDLWSLKEKVRHLFTSEGWTLDKEENMRMVAEHRPYDSPVEIVFTGGITVNGASYALCFKSNCLGFRNKDARIQKRLFDLTFSRIPWTWKKEAYWRKEGKDVLVYKTRHKLRLKRPRKI